MILCLWTIFKDTCRWKNSKQVLSSNFIINGQNFKLMSFCFKYVEIKLVTIYFDIVLAKKVASQAEAGQGTNNSYFCSKYIFVYFCCCHQMQNGPPLTKLISNIFIHSWQISLLKSRPTFNFQKAFVISSVAVYSCCIHFVPTISIIVLFAALQGFNFGLIIQKWSRWSITKMFYSPAV